ncbi:MAG: hypothetical protein JSS07_12050 [Proteobacteria bacterium]|nr:hypothetical protein [Pseudomonadota bacterium]
MQAIVDNFWLDSTSTTQVTIPYRQCLVTRAAYDIGSNSTKTMAAIVNVCDLSLHQVFVDSAYPVFYRQDLYQSANNEFSTRIQEKGLYALKKAKTNVEQFYDTLLSHQHGKIQHCAVATAAFRKAQNGEYVVKNMRTTLDIPIKIISQEEEGKLAYYSAMTQLQHQDVALSPIIWDIGGGSMQLTFKEEDQDFKVLGSDLASQTFHALILSEFKKKNTPHPMDEAQVKAAIKLAKQHFKVDNELLIMIQQKIAKGHPIVALGAVHNQVVQPFCHEINRAESLSIYHKTDLYKAIQWLTNKTDDEIQALLPGAATTFVKNQLTNLILVYAIMDVLGIDKVHTLQASNVQGLLIKGCNIR